MMLAITMLLQPNQQQWISLMDSYGASRRPFLFVISYDAQRAYVWPADAIPGGVAFQLPSTSRVPPVVPLPEQIGFDVEAPTPQDYARAFHHVHEEICAGNSYLLNLCARSRLRTNLRLRDFFHHASAPYKLLVEGSEEKFCCFSPEPFVLIHAGEISSYPMKGTISADLPDAEHRLLADEKERCEHATIVDLIRNDLSRVSTRVHVPRYRYVERVETARKSIFQTSSEVRGSLPEGWEQQLGSMLAQLLPAGSISGAPKRKTCEIIAEAERMERGFYTGVFGYFDGTALESAVCIRFVEQQGEELFYKSGGGITAMSELQSEYEELVSKVYVPFYVPISP